MRKVLALVILVITGLLAACGIIRYDRDFSGKVIDRESKVPIAGVVIIGSWSDISPTPAGAVYSANSVHEVLSGKDGNFCLPGRGLVFLVDEPNIEIFKSGYDNIDLTFHTLKDKYTLDTFYKDKVRWDSNSAMISLKKLTDEERLKNIGNIGRYIHSGLNMTSSGLTTDNKIKNNRKLFDAEIEKERDYYEELKDRQERADRLRNARPWYGTPPSEQNGPQSE